MAIVKMNKLSVIGLDIDKANILEDLMSLGVVEIRSGDAKLQDERWSELVSKDDDEINAMRCDKSVARADEALGVLSSYADIKQPLFSSRKRISGKEYAKLAKKEKRYEKAINSILSLNDEIGGTYAVENSETAKVAALTPWTEYDLPLEQNETELLRLELGVLPVESDLTAVMEKIENAGFEISLKKISEDNEQYYVSLWYFMEDGKEVADLLKAEGYTRVDMDEMRGTANENIRASEKKISAAIKKREDLREKIKSKASCMEEIEHYHDIMVIKRDESKIRSRLLKTESTFTFDGWLPADSNGDLEKVLGKYSCLYEFSEPEEGDVIPVQMKNSKLVSPLEFITKMYALPGAGEVDPTMLYSIFYIIFFGIMFADIGYGVVLSIITFLAIKKYDLYEGSVSELMKLLFYCGISSAFWGIMFGSFFGDLVQVTGKTFFGTELILKPLWINPIDSAMTMLVFSCALGVIHLFVGMGIDIYKKVKAGDVLAAINDDVVWYAVVTGLIMWLFGGKIGTSLPTVGRGMAMTGLAAAIIIPIFKEKGISKAIGLWNIYSGITGNLSDILSYSRLLGLGLASASIAQVMNFLASMGGKGFAGMIMFVIVEIIGHAFNFAINALGSFVHSARLQYVEFFGRFFDGDGTEFRPFKKDTKYINIIEEVK